MGEKRDELRTSAIGPEEDRAALTRRGPLSGGTGARTDAQEIKAEIAETRAELSETLEAIQERLTPRHLIDQAKSTVKDATVGRVQQIMNTAGDTASDLAARGRAAADSVAYGVRENPAPAALIGLGLGWFLYRDRGQGVPLYRSVRENPIPSALVGFGIGWLLKNAREASGTSAWRREAWEAGDRGWQGESEPLYEQGSTESLGRRVRQVTERAGEVAGRARAEVSHRAHQAQHQIDRLVRENPLAFGIAALAIGAAVGLSVFGHDPEDEWMGEARTSP
jgi:ElaB/YqjD/DUF883 family membrane-anchored ribosome-binding protein